jgi:UDP:flavonoid glycosyltransferase YjiC (YdhE family)
MAMTDGAARVRDAFAAAGGASAAADAIEELVVRGGAVATAVIDNHQPPNH